MKYYIQHKGYVGYHLMFWRPNGGGYTCDIDDAWVLTKKQAKGICRMRPSEDFPRKESDLIITRHAILKRDA